MCVHVLMIEYSIHVFLQIASCHIHAGSTRMNEVEYPLGVMMGFVLQDGWTPLVFASQNGHLEIVKSLIEAGSNVNLITKVV